MNSHTVANFRHGISLDIRVLANGVGGVIQMPKLPSDVGPDFVNGYVKWKWINNHREIIGSSAHCSGIYG
jgi:hypothetical protein